MELFDSLLDCFAEVFDDKATYNDDRPDREYLRALLATDYFFAVVAYEGDKVIGGLAAYELKKFEQRRSEIYIYDLAVSAAYRRRGVATGLIEKLKLLAAERSAWVVFVQADHGDEAAIQLYTKLGVREDVLHFDIPVNGQAD